MSDAQQIKEAVSIARNRRTDAMFVVACMFVGWLVFLVVHSDVGEYGQGVITLVLGMFLKELQAMYSYETGTTRGEVSKSETIKDIAKSVPVAAAVAAATSASQISSNVQPWVTGKMYTNEQVVSPNGSGIAYVCMAPHTSGVFSDDLGAGRWALKNP